MISKPSKQPEIYKNVKQAQGDTTRAAVFSDHSPYRHWHSLEAAVDIVPSALRHRADGFHCTLELQCPHLCAFERAGGLDFTLWLHRLFVCLRLLLGCNQDPAPKPPLSLDFSIVFCLKRRFRVVFLFFGMLTSCVIYRTFFQTCVIPLGRLYTTKSSCRASSMALSAAASSSASIRWDPPGFLYAMSW